MNNLRTWQPMASLSSGVCDLDGSLAKLPIPVSGIANSVLSVATR